MDNEKREKIWDAFNKDEVIRNSFVGHGLP